MTGLAPRDDVFGPGHRALTVGLLLTVAASAFEALAVATVMPLTVADIGGFALYGWAFSSFMLTTLLGITAAGRLADLRGPAVPFAIGTATFVAGLAIGGTARSMVVLIFARAVQGFGAGAISAMAYAVVGRAYAPQAKPRMIALLSSAWVVPGLIGPALAGLVADHLGWPWVFLGLIPLILAGAALTLPPLRRLGASADTGIAGDGSEGGEGEGSGDGLASLALAAGATAALFGLEQENPAVALALVVAGLVLGVPALRALTPPGTLVARPGLPAAVAVMGLLGFAFFAAEAFVPLAVTDVRGRSAAIAGLPLTAGTLAWTAGAWIQARAARDGSRRRLVMVGLALIAAGIAGTATFVLPAIPIAVATAAWTVVALGMGIGYSTAALAILELAPVGHAGRASSALQLANTLGIALGTGLGGALLAATTRLGAGTALGLAWVWVMSAAVALLGIAVARGLPGRPQVATAVGAGHTGDGPDEGDTTDAADPAARIRSGP